MIISFLSRQFILRIESANIWSRTQEKGKYTYENVKRWTKKFDIFKKDKIFLPVIEMNKLDLTAIINAASLTGQR